MPRKPAKEPAKAKAPKAAKPAERNKGGRPTKYSQALLDAICARLRKGEPLVSICDDLGVDDDTVRAWEKRADVGADVSRAIARAREAGEYRLATECLEIADDSRNDWIDGKAAEGDAKAIEARENGETVQRSRLRIDTRLKLLAKFNPRRWGDKVEVEHGGKVTLEQLVAGKLPGE